MYLHLNSSSRSWSQKTPGCLRDGILWRPWDQCSNVRSTITLISSVFCADTTGPLEQIIILSSKVSVFIRLRLLILMLFIKLNPRSHHIVDSHRHTHIQLKYLIHGSASSFNRDEYSLTYCSKSLSSLSLSFLLFPFASMPLEKKKCFSFWPTKERQCLDLRNVKGQMQTSWLSHPQNVYIIWKLIATK